MIQQNTIYYCSGWTGIAFRLIEWQSLSLFFTSIFPTQPFIFPTALTALIKGAAGKSRISGPLKHSDYILFAVYIFFFYKYFLSILLSGTKPLSEWMGDFRTKEEGRKYTS